MKLEIPPQVDSQLAGLRTTIGDAIRSRIAGPDGNTRMLGLMNEEGPRWFAADSPIVRVHGDASMFIGGLRALLLQSMHPLAMAGVATHSDYRNDPWGRLQRTADFLAATTFGTARAAEEAVARVRAVHTRVQGTASDGRAYSANDPHLLRWVHVAEVDSFLRAYRRFGTAPLTDADADRYVDEMAVVCERLGGTAPARSVAELDDFMAGIRPELGGNEQSRDAARWLTFPPLPLAARPAYAVLAPAAIGLLEPWMRRELRLPHVDALDPVVVQPAARALLRGLTWAIEGAIAEESARTGRAA